MGKVKYLIQRIGKMNYGNMFKTIDQVHEKCGKKNGAINGKKRSIPILQFAKDGTFVKEWPSAYEAERQLGILHSNICQCLKGRYKSAGGFVWRYAHG